MRIAVFGNYGVQNLGDDLILKGILEKYKGNGILVFCGNPEQVKKQFGLESYSFFPGGLRSGFRYIFSTEYRDSINNGKEVLRNVDLILVGGGGILVDHHFQALLLWWNQLRIIANTNVPFELIGNSFELGSFWSWFFIPYLKKARSISVRDQSSLKLIHSLGLKAELVEDLSAEAKLTIGPNEPKKLIALALCRWGIGEKQLEAFRKFITAKKSEGFEIYGLAFQTMGDDDREILRQIDPRLQIRTGEEEILETMRTSEAIIAMRFHAVVLAQRLNVPCAALSYQEKVSSFMADKGLADHCIPIQKTDGQSLQELFNEVMRKTAS